MNHSKHFIPLDLTSQKEKANNYWNQTIEQCPADMMLREFVQNGLEAQEIPKVPRIILWEPYRYEGKENLSVINNGRAMTPAELRNLSDMAWSGDNKRQGRTGNKGIGARVTGLRNNKYGLVYLSCCNQRVYQMILRFSIEDNCYGIDAGSRRDPVLEVTQQFLVRERNTDWVRVVFLGDSKRANSLTRSGEKRGAWIAQELTRRYFRIPNAEIRIDRRLTKWASMDDRSHRSVKTLSEWFDMAAYYEAHQIDDGTTIHYAFFHPHEKGDRFRWTVGAANHITTLGAVCWRNELYSLCDGTAWVAEAKHYGIAYVERQTCVVIELPDDAGVFNTMYRDEIRSDQTERAVRLRDFQELVIDNLPKWLREIIAKEAEKHRAKSAEESIRAIEDFYQKLRLWSEEFSAKKDGDTKARRRRRRNRTRGEGLGAGRRRRAPKDIGTPDEIGDLDTEKRRGSLPVPDAEFAWNDQEREEMGFDDLQISNSPVQFAAQVLYFDMTHPIIQNLKKDITNEFRKRTRGKLPESEFEQSLRKELEQAVHLAVASLYGAGRFNESAYSWNKEDSLSAVNNQALASGFAVVALPGVRAIITESLSKLFRRGPSRIAA